MFGTSPLLTLELHASAEFGFDPDDAAVGDLITVTTAGTLTLLNVGSEGNLLIPQSDGTLAWEDAFTSDTGPLKHERGGLEFDASAVTTGDLIRGSAAGTMSLLTIGSAGQVLTVSGGAVTWQTTSLKSPVKAASTANLTLSGEQTIDGVSCVTGDRVLVKDQTTATENGIYVVASGAWSRAADFASGFSVSGFFGHVDQGTDNGDKKWFCENNAGSDVVGTDGLTLSINTAAVVGPVSSTDNAITRWDGTGGDTVQDSGVSISDNDTLGVVNGDATDPSIEWTAAQNATHIYYSDPNRMVFTIDSNERFNVADSGVSAEVTIGYAAAIDNGNSGSADTINWRSGNVQHSTLTDDCTFTFNNPIRDGGSGQERPAHLMLRLIQDGTGNRTVTWPSAVHWAGGTAPTLSTAAGATDIIRFIFDDSTGRYYGDAILNVS